MRKCKTCGKLTQNSYYCCDKCFAERNGAKYNKKCVMCGGVFLVKPCWEYKKYCSKKCRKIAARKERITINCMKCNIEFEIIYTKKGITKYCSSKCFGEANTKNMRLKNIGFFGLTRRQRHINSIKSIETQKKNKTGWFKSGVHEKALTTQLKNKTGFYGMTHKEHFEAGILAATVNRMNGTAFFDKKIQLSGSKAGNRSNRQNSTGICYDRKLREKYPVPTKDTSIEIKIQTFLKYLKLKILKHRFINKKYVYQYDIFVPSLKLIIECDGDAYHYNPKIYNKDDKIFKNGLSAVEKWKLDANRTNELKTAGYNVLRLWGSEIDKMNLDDFNIRLQGVLR